MSKAKKLIDEFDIACREKAWKGSRPPQDWDAIDSDYFIAKRDLMRYIEKLENRLKLLEPK